jgi:hypothetical protein
VTHHHAFILVSAIIFAVVALVHALRLALSWQVRIGPLEIPMWFSTLGMIVAAGLCTWAFWLLF